MAKHKRTASRSLDPYQAVRVQDQLHQRGDYSHLRVRSRGSHLIIEAHDTQGQHPLVRLSHLGAGHYRVSVHRNTRWQPKALCGPLDQVLEELLTQLHPRLTREAFWLEKTAS